MAERIYSPFLTSPNKSYLYLLNSFFAVLILIPYTLIQWNFFFVSISTHIFFLLLLILIILVNLLFLYLFFTLDAVADDDSFLDFDFVRVMAADLILWMSFWIRATCFCSNLSWKLICFVDWKCDWTTPVPVVDLVCFCNDWIVIVSLLIW
jgi:hypothetical protein